MLSQLRLSPKLRQQSLAILKTTHPRERDVHRERRSQTILNIRIPINPLVVKGQVSQSK